MNCSARHMRKPEGIVKKYGILQTVDLANDHNAWNEHAGVSPDGKYVYGFPHLGITLFLHVTGG